MICLTHTLNLLFYSTIEYFGMFTQYRVNKKSQWEVDSENWPKLRNRSIFLNFLNIYVVSLIVLYALSFVHNVKPNERIPGPIEIYWQLIFCIIIESNTFFLMHIIGHQYLYKLHKVHHEFRIPHALAAVHSEPIDFIIGTLMPTGLGFLILGGRMHFLTMCYWIIWRLS